MGDKENFRRGGRRNSGEPDFACMIHGRRSRNAILEVAYSQLNYDLVSKLLDYLTRTNDVMVSMGIKIYRRRLDGTVAMVFMTFERLAPNRNVATRLISFGTAPVHPNARRSLEQLSGTVMSGVGIGAAHPCNAENIDEYCVSIPYNLMINLDNDGIQLFQPLHIQQPPNYIVSLYNVQLDILLAMEQQQLADEQEELSEELEE
jgi:hypothetical protein